MVALFCTRMKGGCFPFLICCFCSAMLHLAMWNLSDGDVISACISKDAFMKAPDESGINKDFTEKSTDWIATDVKRCTDGVVIKRDLHSLILGCCVKEREKLSFLSSTTWWGLKKMLMLIFGTWGKGDQLRNIDVTF